jgi:single-strand DNA-binding protein
MSSLNRATLIGRLGKDPEVRYTQANQKIVHLNLATSERWKDRSGQDQERTEWHRVVIFNEARAGVAERYLKKGSQCLVEGKIVTRKWADQGGQERYSTEIQLGPYDVRLLLLGSRSRDGAGQTNDRPQSPPATRPSRADELDDEIPF